MNLQELAAKTLKQIDRAKALVAVNVRIEKLARRLVKMGWSPEYVGSTMLGAGIDMLQSAHVSRDIIFGAIEKGLESYDSGNIKSAFTPSTVSDPDDTKETDDTAGGVDVRDR